MKDYNKKIGSLLREIRTEKGLSLQNVADVLGVNKSSVYYWETGRNTISAEDMVNYLHALNYSPDEFIKKVVS